MFDANSFMSAAINSSSATKIVPVPVGEYLGFIKGIKPRVWQSADGTKSGLALDVTWLIEDEGVKAQLKRTEVTCRQSIMLDATEDGRLMEGDGVNIGLGLLRAAVGKNSDGESFSLAMLPGLSARVQVSHRPDTSQSAQPGDVFAEVKSVFKM